MNTRFWTKKDVTRSKEFIAAIVRRLKTRRIYQNLECFVGGRGQTEMELVLEHTQQGTSNEVSWVFNSLVHSLRTLSTFRRSGLRTASAAVKPCQGDSSKFYLITGSTYTDQRRTVVLATLFNESEQRHFRLSITDEYLEESPTVAAAGKRHMKADLSVEDGHLCNMGKMIEELEGKLRNQLDQVYFGKTKEMVCTLRPPSELLSMTLLDSRNQ
ncbi:integrase, catalytic region, zinc finger, CCHC-type containing protein [Tanacetum coccineum]|uniref:F-actin-capping protein subunit beta n=1 Tax=Tanacetum coccineum TaxID=301880 RepID=A0ABQ5D6Q6_9ASTR